MEQIKYDKYEAAFNREMEREGVEPMDRVSNAMRSMQEEMLRDMPIWMRFNFASNIINREMGISGNKPKDSDINWNRVNTLLTDNRSKYDYNNFNTINSIEDLENARVNCILSSEGMGMWFRGKCKICREEFFMSKGEVKFYENKEFELPKKCTQCRESKKIGVASQGGIIKKITKTIINETPPEQSKTSMEEAMIKAGIISEKEL